MEVGLDVILSEQAIDSTEDNLHEQYKVAYPLEPDLADQIGSKIRCELDRLHVRCEVLDKVRTQDCERQTMLRRKRVAGNLDLTVGSPASGPEYATSISAN